MAVLYWGGLLLIDLPSGEPMLAFSDPLWQLDHNVKSDLFDKWDSALQNWGSGNDETLSYVDLYLTINGFGDEVFSLTLYSSGLRAIVRADAYYRLSDIGHKREYRFFFDPPVILDNKNDPGYQIAVNDPGGGESFYIWGSSDPNSYLDGAAYGWSLGDVADIYFDTDTAACFNYCHRSTCDGKCHPVKEGLDCPDCERGACFNHCHRRTCDNRCHPVKEGLDCPDCW